MAFHTVAYEASIADVTATDITPVPDSIMLIQNGHFVPQRNMQILYASYQAAGATRARLITPTFRQQSTPWIRPTGLAIVQGAEPHIADYRNNPLTLMGLEEVEFEALQTSGGAAVVYGIMGWASSPQMPAPQGQCIVMRGTGTTTVTAKAWSLATITWQDFLPSGNYACVGLESFGTTAIAARLVFEQQVERPGCVAIGLATSRSHSMFQTGGLGVWGTFTANRMPNVEVLCNAADTAEELYLHFVRIG